jgi:hypothetical protein
MVVEELQSVQRAHPRHTPARAVVVAFCKVPGTSGDADAQVSNPKVRGNLRRSSGKTSSSERARIANPAVILAQIIEIAMPSGFAP